MLLKISESRLENKEVGISFFDIKENGYHFWFEMLYQVTISFI